MATQGYVTDNQGVKIDRIVSRAVATIRDNPLVVFGLSLAFAGVPSLIVNGFSQRYRLAIAQNITTNPRNPFELSGLWGVAMIAGFAILLLYILAQGAIVRVTTAAAEGRRASFGECAGAGLRAALPLIELNILFGLAIGFASIFLLIPGIIVYVIWSMANPALVAERIGVFAAFSRSRYLTKGARWKVFGVELLTLVIVWLISALLGLIAAGVLGLAGFGAMQRVGAPIWYLGLSAIFQTIIVAIWGTLQTSLYIELRDWKDGPAGSALADVFA